MHILIFQIQNPIQLPFQMSNEVRAPNSSANEMAKTKLHVKLHGLLSCDGSSESKGIRLTP